MRPRATSYRNIDDSPESVKWYWRTIAVGSSFMILGGYLILPATFEKARMPLDGHGDDDQHPDIRVTPAALGIIAIALLAAAFSFTGLLCFAVRNAVFQRDLIFMPCLASSVLGLLTVIYDFLVFSRYEFKLPALLTTIAATLSTIIFSALLVFCQRRITKAQIQQTYFPQQQLPVTVPLASHPHRDSEATLWQDPSYYENYNRNMFPTAQPPTQPPIAGYDPSSITEEEMQRQQMLMLLLNRDHVSTPDPSASTFRLDWQGQEEEDARTPIGGHYAPGSAYPQTAYPGPGGLIRRMTDDLQPWDGVWRTPMQMTKDRGRMHRPTSREIREARRREIEEGSRP